MIKLETQNYIANYMGIDSTYDQIVAEAYDYGDIRQQALYLENHVMARAAADGFMLIDLVDFDFATELYNAVIDRYGRKSGYDGRY